MRRSAAIVLTVTLLGIALEARAHSPPRIEDLVRTADGQLVLVTNRGLIFGPASDGGAWHLLCGSALGLQVDDLLEVVLPDDGRLLAATGAGLLESSDAGCSWQAVPGMDEVFATSLVHDRDAAALFVAVSAEGRNGIDKSEDGGLSWHPVLELTDYDVVLKLVTAPSGEGHLYGSGYSITPASSTRTHVLHHTTDAGRTWQALTPPLVAPDAELIVQAVDPTDPARLLVLADGPEEDTALLSRDGGQSLEPVLTSSGLSSATFDGEGGIWIAGDDGLWHGGPSGGELERLGEAQLMTFVTAAGDAIYAGGHYSGFDPVQAGLGLTRDAGRTFAPVARFTEVTEQVTCPAASPALWSCEELWYDWQVEVLVSLGQASLDSVKMPASDEPAAPAPADPEATPITTNAAADSGCSVSGPGSAASPSRWLCWLCVSIALRLAPSRRARGSRRCR